MERELYFRMISNIEYAEKSKSKVLGFFGSKKVKSLDELSDILSKVNKEYDKNMSEDFISELCKQDNGKWYYSSTLAYNYYVLLNPISKNEFEVSKMKDYVLTEEMGKEEF